MQLGDAVARAVGYAGPTDGCCSSAGSSSWRVDDSSLPSTPRAPSPTALAAVRSLFNQTSTLPADQVKLHTLKCADGVQQSDARFFETFSGLATRLDHEKHTQLVELAAQRRRLLDERESFRLTRFSSAPQTASRADLYVEVLYTIRHRVGGDQDDADNHKLAEYARVAFNVDLKDHNQLAKMAEGEKPPVVVLNAVIKSARDLIAKDANGFSDPFCMLGIVPGKREGLEEGSGGSQSQSPTSPTNAKLAPGNNGGAKASNTSNDSGRSSPTEDKKRSGGLFNRIGGSFRRRSKKGTKGGASPDVSQKKTLEKSRIPAKLVRATSVQKKTLNPTWNEKFQLIVEDDEADSFHIDIWDHDDESSVVEAVCNLNEVASFKGLGRYFKQVAQSARSNNDNAVDDFLGCITVHVKDIPSNGVESWWPLQARSEKSNVSGEILIKLWLGTREERMGHDDGDNMLDVLQHIAIIKEFAGHEIDKAAGGGADKWDGRLCDAARQILQQHAVQGDLTHVQQAMCSWVAHCWLHHERGLSFPLMQRLLNDLVAKWTVAALSKDEEELLAEAFSQYLDLSYDQIGDFCAWFSPLNQDSAKAMRALLKTLSELHTSELMARCLPYQVPLNDEMKSLIPRSADTYYYRAKEKIDKDKGSDSDDSYTGLADLLVALNAACEAAVTVCVEAFAQILETDYFDAVYMEFDQLLDAEACSTSIAETWEKKKLKALSATNVDAKDLAHVETLVPIFEMQVTYAEFARHRLRCSSQTRNRRTWRAINHVFDKAAKLWLEIAKVYLTSRIDLACELDKIIESSSTDVRQSTSYVDVCFTLKQSVDFWERLEFSEPIAHATHTEKMMQLVCKGIETYTEKVFAFLEHTGFYDDGQKFTEAHLNQLFVTINDAEQARRVASDMSDRLRLDEIAARLADLQDASRAAQWQSTVEHVVDSCRSCVAGHIDLALERLMRRKQAEYAKLVFHLAFSPSSCPAEEAGRRLIDKLDTDMTAVHKRLLHRNFVRYLTCLYKTIMSLIQKTVDENQGQESEFYTRLEEAVDIIDEFFNAGGVGLRQEALESTAERQRLVTILQSYGRSTVDLIHMYYRRYVQLQVGVFRLSLNFIF